MKCTVVKKRNSITFQFTFKNEQYRIYSGIVVEEKEWNKKERKVTNKHSNHEKLNQLIQKMKSTITSYLIEQNITGKKVDLVELKGLLGLLNGSRKKKVKPVNIVDAFELFLEDRSHELAPKTIVGYKNSLNHLMKYQNKKGKIIIEEIDSKFRSEYLKYLKQTPQLSPSSRGKQIKNIKCVLNHLCSKGLLLNSQFRYFKKEREDTPMVYTNHEELTRVYNFNDCSIADKKVLDIYCFMSYTGLRYSDYNSITHENFIEGSGHLFLQFIQQKTKSKVSFPILYRNAVEIAEKYDYQLPKMTNAYLNRRLKSVLKKNGLVSGKISLSKEKNYGVFEKVDLITVHTARRSFATNQYLKGTPIHLIMAVTGHKSEKAFRVYIKAEQMEQSKKLLQYTDYHS